MTALEAMKQMGINTNTPSSVKTSEEMYGADKVTAMRDTLILLDKGLTINQVAALSTEDKRWVVMQL